MPTKTHAKICQNEQCKKPFFGYAHSKYCSQECYRQSYSKKRQNKQTRLINCLWCHTPVNATSFMQLYCSLDCREKYKKTKEAIERKYPFEYDVCNREYERLKIEGCRFSLEGVT